MNRTTLEFPLSHRVATGDRPFLGNSSLRLVIFRTLTSPQLKQLANYDGTFIAVEILEDERLLEKPGAW